MRCSFPQTVYQKFPGAPIQWRRPNDITHETRVFEKPCGQCQSCRARKAMDWQTRLMLETAMYQPWECHFTTFTYDEGHVPVDGSVRLEETQNLMKRIRQFAARALRSPTKVRFFCAAEYGELSTRCHYHVLLFGLPLLDLRPEGKSRANGQMLYGSAALDACWQHRGLVRIGAVTAESCGYVARYVVKKLSDGSPDHAAAYGEREIVHPFTGEIRTVDLQPEFATMSRGRRADGGGGIGYSWFQRWHKDVFPSDFIILDGQKRPVPEYYLKLADEEMQERIKASRLSRGTAATERELELALQSRPRQIGDPVTLSAKDYDERYRRSRLGLAVSQESIAKAAIDTALLDRRRETKVEVLRLNINRVKREFGP